MMLRVWIDPQMCMAHGLCVAECPQVFEFRADVGGRAVITTDAEGFFESHADAIRNAYSFCPMAAIHIEEHGTLKPDPNVR
jgi:ferredoxin